VTRGAPLPCRICEESPNRCHTVAGGAGAAGADVVVFVSAQATSACTGATGAHAKACSQDNEDAYGLLGRPLSGYINFCPRSNDLGADKAARQALVDTAVHELIHTLFMSSALYDSYIDSAGSPAPCASPHCRILPLSCEHAPYLACSSAGLHDFLHRRCRQTRAERFLSLAHPATSFRTCPMLVCLSARLCDFHIDAAGSPAPCALALLLTSCAVDTRLIIV
jgi:hypothetical protein